MDYVHYAMHLIHPEDSPLRPRASHNRVPDTYGASYIFVRPLHRLVKALPRRMHPKRHEDSQHAFFLGRTQDGYQPNQLTADVSCTSSTTTHTSTYAKSVYIGNVDGEFWDRD